MIELYGMGSPNVVKIYIALEELDLPYTVHPLDVFSGRQFDPAFLKLNPMAKVPVAPAASPARCSSQARSCSTSPRRRESCCRRIRRQNTRRSSG
jgi:Glutathione S-transferase, N-terminal domain